MINVQIRKPHRRMAKIKRTGTAFFGQPRYNAETLAAFAEGEAMKHGEIPSKIYTSWDEFVAEIDAEIAAEEAAENNA